MKRALVCIIFLSIFLKINCTNLEEEIVNYRIDSESFIRNARVMLADELENGNVEKVKEITALLVYRYKHRLKEVFHAEELFVMGAETDSLALIFDYVFIISKARADYYNCRGRSPFPSDDKLYKASNNLLDEKIDIYIQKIKESNYTHEEKDFILLCLKARFNYIYIMNVKDLNDACDEFLVKYPDSRYENFIRDSLRNVYKPGKWGNGYIFNAGYSNCVGRLGKYLKGGISFQAGLHLSINSLTTGLEFKYDMLQSNSSFQENGDWSRDDIFAQQYIGLQLGYNFFDLHKLSLEPYLSIGYSELRYERKSRGKEISHDVITMGCGLTARYRLKGHRSIIGNPYHIGANYIALSLDYKQPNYNIEESEIKSGVISIYVGYGYYFRREVKVR